MSMTEHVSFDSDSDFFRWPPPEVPRAAGRSGRQSVAFIAILAVTLVLVGAIRPDLRTQDLVTRPAAVGEGARSQMVGLLVTRFFRAVDSSTLSSVRVDDIPTALHDPYTHFLTPSEYQRLNDLEHGRFVGVGIDVGAHNGSLRIDRVVPGSPAGLAGVELGDVIVAVDRVDVRLKSLEQTLALVRGPEGRNVQIAVRRGDVTMWLTMTRAVMHEGMVLHELRVVNGHSVGLLTLLDFSEGVGERARTAVRELIDAGAQGIVVDLRGNPGGWASEALRVAEIFLPLGTRVLTERGAHIAVKSFATRFGPEDVAIPVALLVDHLTASSAEIVAGALHDNGRAKLFGETTFGKGRIQDIVELVGGGAFKFTYAEYLTPSGFELDGIGLTPDVEVRAGRTNVLDPSFNSAVDRLFAISR